MVSKSTAVIVFDIYIHL